MHIPIIDVSKVPPAPRNERRKGLWKAAPAAWIMGWIFSGLGLAFIIVMLVMQLGSRPSSLFPDFFIERSPGHAIGVVDEVIWVTSNKGNHTHRLEFTFSAESESNIFGFCYTTNASAFEVGQQVGVEYEEGNPQVSRVEGTRAGRVHYLLFVFADVFFLAGMLALHRALNKRRRVKRALRTGLAVEGRVTQVVLLRTMKINHVSPWKVSFEFKPQSGTMSSGTCYIYPDTNKNPEKPTHPGSPCVVLYNEDAPAQCTLAYEADFI